jgi:hypothetical protein
MRKTSIQPGDHVKLSATNGLGNGDFYVLEVDPRDVIHQLYVEGTNGVRWWARAEGARIVRS